MQDDRMQGKMTIVLLALQFVLMTCDDSDQMTTSGGHCVFPFTYKGVVYRSCTSKNSHRPWCSTSSNYDDEGEWGYCAGFTSSGVKTTSGQYCVFPFIYEDEVYKSCTSKDRFRPWCSLTVNYDADHKWGNCAGHASSGIKTSTGDYCVFPFTYKNVVYKSCTTKDHDRPWCSLTANSDKDQKWADCIGFYSSTVKTTSGEYCAFPFLYRGDQYNTCTMKYHHKRWCPTTIDYDKDKKWGNCA